MGVFTQLRLLLWKNFTLQRRRILLSIIELGVPLIFALVILFLRSKWELMDETRAIYYYKEPIPDKIEGTELVYYPKTTETEKLMAWYYRHPSYTEEPPIKGFVKLKDAIEYQNTGVNKLKRKICVIIFTNVKNSPRTPLPKKLNYKLRILVPGSSFFFKHTYRQLAEARPRPTFIEIHFTRVIVSIQKAIGRAFTNYLISKTRDFQTTDIYYQVVAERMPYPPFRFDRLRTDFTILLPIAFTVSFIFTVIVGVKALVQEKEQKLKEAMKMMGLKAFIHWVSWYIFFLIYLIPVCGIMTFLYFYEVSSNGPIFYYGDPYVFFVFLSCYSLAVISFCFMVSTMVQKANVGSLIGGGLFLAFFFIYYGMKPVENSIIKRLSCLSLNVPFAFGIDMIGLLEVDSRGLQWSNIKERHLDGVLSILDCMIMFLVDAVLYLVIAWYLDNVHPGEYGVPKPYNFFLTKDYWTGAIPIIKKDFETKTEVNSQFEKEPEGLKPGIQIQNLGKKFGPKVAVAGTSLNLYEDQITVLLGHNGAGKTTTISMITGFIPPTSGTALVDGHDIRTEMTTIHKSMGCCPQHDILFDHLTVKEHLEFFGIMKGCSKETLASEIIYWVERTKLKDKVKTQARFLSGGQKRKLSLAIALIGGPKIVIFDEPSAGMDPAARREAWDLIQGARKGRTILLTTHYMDEADLLGDRIAIMSHGTVVCCGTSMFLKALYGTGYHLIVVKDWDCDVPILTEFVKHYIPTSKLENIITNEITYLLPTSESGSFPLLFRALEKKKIPLGIDSFGTTATTLEEVFLKAGDDADSATLSPPKTIKMSVDNSTSASRRKSTQTTFNTGYQKKTGCALIVSQLQGLIVKKVLYNWRNVIRLLFVQIFLPFIFATFGSYAFLALDKGSVQNVDSLLLKYNLEQFGPSVFVPYSAALEQNYPSAIGNNGRAGNFTKENAMKIAERFASLYCKQFDRTSAICERPPSGISMEDYMLNRSKELGTLRYGMKMVVGLLVQMGYGYTAHSMIVTAFYSTLPYHSAGVAVNYAMNTIIQYFLNDTSYGLQSSTEAVKSDSASLAALYAEEVHIPDTFALLIFIDCGMCFAISMFIYFPIKERQVGAKHMQLVSGAYLIVFWLSHFLLDFIIYMVATIISVVIFAFFEIEGLVDSEQWHVTFAVFTLFGWAILPSMYAGHFLFKLPTTGLVIVFIVCVKTGIVPLIIVNVLGREEETRDQSEDLNDYFSIFFPNYNFIMSLQDISLNYFFKEYCEPKQAACSLVPNPCCKDNCSTLERCIRYHEDYLAWDRPGIGKHVIALGAQGAVAFLVLVIIESRIILRVFYIVKSTCFNNHAVAMVHVGREEDTDVTRERRRIFGCASKRMSRQRNIVDVRQILSNPSLVFKKEETTPVEATNTDTTTSGDIPNGTTPEQDAQPLAADTTPNANVNSSVGEQPEANFGNVPNQGMTTTSTAAYARKASRRHDVMLITNLYKRFGNFVAVDHICVGIHEQDCFGLLGQNGAGKTTTFKMLTGEYVVTGGDAYLDGHSIRTNIKKVHRNLGYCPQFDALIDELTGRETLTFYGRLKGIPRKNIMDVVSSLLDTVMLTRDADFRCGTYSGGNKRKLSTAIALIGDPHFIMLDEPTAGMDPKARRQMWDVLGQIRASGRTMILTSHSMEECDALCTKIAIMVSGRFVCLGSPQHLKNKFAQGYTLIVKLGEEEDGSIAPTEPVVEYIKNVFQGAKVVDDHQGYIHFQVPDVGLSLADVFELMEETKKMFKVTDYSVQQTTLEQVFLSFTKDKVLARSQPKGCEKMVSNCFCVKLCMDAF